jgi:hypothetical protein
MKAVKYLPLLALVLTFVGLPNLLASPQQSNSIDDKQRDSAATNSNTPANPNNISTNTTSIVTARAQMNQDQRKSGGSALTEYDTPEQALKDDSWFRSPAVFADYGYSTANDSRAFGLDSDQHDVNVGFDFLTVYDIIAGMMLTYSNFNGTADDLPGAFIRTETKSVQLSWYLSKQINEWLFAGTTFSYALSDLDTSTATVGNTDFDIDTFATSVFIGATQNWDSFGLASTVSYVYVDATWDPVNQAGVTNDFNQSSGTFLWKTSGTWFATDWLDLTAAYQMTQIVHENFNTIAPAGTKSDDNHWGTVSLTANFIPAQNWAVFTGVEYVVFNDNYQESVTVRSGATYSF